MNPEVAAAGRQMAGDMREAVAYGTAPGLGGGRGTGLDVAQMPVHPLPDLTLAHAAFALRSGARTLRWVDRAAMTHPGVLAAVLWVIYAGLRELARTATAAALEIVYDGGQPVRDSSGRLLQQQAVELASLGGPAGVASVVAWYAAMLLTFGAVAAFVTGLMSEPTHRVGADGRLRRVHGHTSRARRRTGGYRRLKVRRLGVVKDWRAAKRDARQINRGLARVGRYRLSRAGRRWAVEDAHGAERTRLGPIDRALVRRVEPSKRARKWGAGYRKALRAGRAAKGRERRALDAEWASEVARIDGRGPAPGPRLDPVAGPQPAPGPASEDGQVGEWGERATVAAERAQRAHWADVGYVGYQPPDAPGGRP